MTYNTDSLTSHTTASSSTSADILSAEAVIVYPICLTVLQKANLAL